MISDRSYSNKLVLSMISKILLSKQHSKKLGTTRTYLKDNLEVFFVKKYFLIYKYSFDSFLLYCLS